MDHRPFRVSLIDLATILYNVHRGAQLTNEVGFEDCDRTIKQLTKDLSPKRANVDQAEMESGLWSCNLMDEAGQWWSPTGESFDAFLARILKYAPRKPGQTFQFDKFYNLLKKTENNIKA